jgi:hypothetical protein
VLVVKELDQYNIRGLVINNMTESKPNNDLIEPKLVQQGDNNLLIKQPIENQFVTPNFT